MNANAMTSPALPLSSLLWLLALVVALWLVRAVLPRWLAGRAAGGGSTRMQVLEVRRLDARKSLILVAVDGEQLLLGATDAHIATLSRLRAPHPTPEAVS